MGLLSVTVRWARRSGFGDLLKRLVEFALDVIRDQGSEAADIFAR
jgi:hypothetical protein